MADWGKAIESFQRSSQWAQDFRANRQLERARDQALERGEYDLQSQRAFRKTTNPDAASVLGEGYAAGNTDWTGQLEDPFAFKLFDWFKQKLSKKGGKKRKALDLGGEGGFNTSNPVGTGEEEYTPAETYALPETDEVEATPFADGGDIANAMEAARGATQTFATQAGQAPVMTVQAGGAQPMPSVTGVIDTSRNYADGGSIDEVKNRRKASAKEVARGTDRSNETRSTRKALDVGPKETAYSRANRVTGEFMQTRPLPQDGRTGLARAARGARNLGRMVKGAGALGALGATALDVMDTPTEQYRERFGLETDDPSLLGDIGVRAGGALSDLANVLTLGAAGRLYRDKQRIAAENAVPGATEFNEAPPAAPQQALPVAASGRASAAMRVRGAGAAPDPEMVNFGDIDIDAREVPDMKTDDWKRYRAEMIAAAQKSGDPSAVARVNDMVTEMQMKGFLNYGQQGLALQQAGNIRGAMAAYRAAFQYFPNGNDVEFGTLKNKRTGRLQIVGFAKDEKTGKIVPGSELIMDPERVAVILENFKNPQAFRLWTKDWRDFQQEQRKYEEVTKPLAQAQADALANNSEANVLRAENAALRARGSGYDAADMRGDATAFRNAPGLSELMLTEPDKAQYLLGVMGRIKARYPQLTPDDIATATLNAANNGTLDEWLGRMGITQ